MEALYPSRLLCIVVALACVNCVTQACAQRNNNSLLVNLADGTRLRGSQEGSVITFKGIPFAEAPIGDRRWTPPVAWTNPDTSEVLDATTFGHTCVQWLW